MIMNCETLRDGPQAAQQTSAGSTQVLASASELAANGERLKQEVDTFLHTVRAG